jgi:YVTN family beta-propeller protein
MKALFAGITIAAGLWILWAQDTPPQSAQPVDAAKKQKARRPPPPGVATPGVKREMSTLQPEAVFPVEGTPDWQVVTDDAIWVSNGPKNSVHRLDVKTNTVAAAVTVGKRPCSGLTAGFGSIWVPNCGDHTVSRVDRKTNAVVATISAGPSASEGGVAASPEGVWLVTDAKGVLSKIDPAQNKVTAEVTVPENSAGVTYGEGAIWVTTPEKNMLTRVDPKTATVTHSIEVGSKPRFLTTGAGSAWTLNQGDGTITRVDGRTGKVVATIEAGLIGTGGELAFGEGRVWATLFQIPLTEIDPATNQVTRQWTGPGGDSVRAAHGSIWLSNLREQNVWRVKL